MQAHLVRLLILLPLGLDGPTDDPPTANGPEGEGAAVSTGLVVERGRELGFTLPVDEMLEFEVSVDLALVGETRVGTFGLSAGTDLFRAGLASADPAGSKKKVGWIRGHASGGYLNYHVDHVIEARILPQVWPRVIYRDTQTGSENRKRELMYGRREGKAMSWYRSDRHCKGCERPEHMMEGTWPFSSDHHCKKCKRAEHRIWRRPEMQESPEAGVDMLSAIHLARTMVREGHRGMAFPLLDKRTWWDVTLTLAKRRDVETPAGVFHCREVKLDPKRADGDEDTRFRGLFGIHGSLSFWMEERTGVPVKIEGVVPAGPFELDVELLLEKYSGVPQEFEPLP